MKFSCSKTYGHSVGFSCAFRQWRAEGNCKFLHGYALSIKIEFEADYLDERGWVVDFGSMKRLKEWLAAHFDHKTLVAADDPLLPLFEALDRAGAIHLIILPAVGCERFAEKIFKRANDWLIEKGLAERCRVSSVEVREHEGNGATIRK